jgi:hypothetical protein
VNGRRLASPGLSHANAIIIDAPWTVVIVSTSSTHMVVGGVECNLPGRHACDERRDGQNLPMISIEGVAESVPSETVQRCDCPKYHQYMSMSQADLVRRTAAIYVASSDGLSQRRWGVVIDPRRSTMSSADVPCRFDGCDPHSFAELLPHDLRQR